MRSFWDDPAFRTELWRRLAAKSSSAVVFFRSISNHAIAITFDGSNGVESHSAMLQHSFRSTNHYYFDEPCSIKTLESKQDTTTGVRTYHVMLNSK